MPKIAKRSRPKVHSGKLELGERGTRQDLERLGCVLAHPTSIGQVYSMQRESLAAWLSSQVVEFAQEVLGHSTKPNLPELVSGQGDLFQGFQGNPGLL
mmetsp:Transcript_23631/g.48205  ORF Transcript_23631/g.48205 Transcript_23631/m.48205 type:complete len:98 (+) Transcript_23631:619-912(+)